MKAQHLKLCKTIFFCFIFLFSGKMISQELPQVVPVSPEAASLGKYGEIPVNLATGKINYTVPLYTIDVGGFQWPIYLSYNYNGLVVEQDPPMTGLGWDLMATGRITRQIRGIPDEIGGSSNTSYKKNVIVPYLELGTQPSSLYDLYRNIATNAFDGQNDKYYINAGNLSGSYVYNEDNDVVFLNHRNYKVNNTIITDEGGIKYYFEQSELGDFNVNAPEGATQEFIPVSYLLTKIELPNNKGIINFEYYPTISYLKEVISETEVISFAAPNESNIDQVFKTVRNTPIKKIIFPNGEVRFNVTTAIDNTIETASLNNVSVWHNNTEVMNYSFSYSNSSKNLKTLNSINKNSGNQVLPWYSFEYEPLPTSINYKQQDLWGFFNGKPNANLINGSREIVFDKTLSGALKTINYPTKGYTEIVYEPNKIVGYTSNSNSDCSYSHNKTITGQLIGDSNPKYIDTIIKIPSNQIVSIYAYARVGNGSFTNMLGAEASIEIKTFGQAVSCGVGSIYINKAISGEDAEAACMPGNNPPCPELYTDSITQIGFTEDASIYITGSVEAPQGKEAKIYYSISYEDRIDEDKFIGGLRVAQTKDCNNSNDCITTDYKYINTDNTSSGYLLGPDLVFYYSILYRENGVSGNKYYKSTNSMQNFNSFQGAPVLYDRVELLKNGGINGKIVKYFSKFGNQGLTDLPFLEQENNDWKNGKLVKTEIFKKQSGQFSLQKKEENFYNEFFSYGESNNSTSKAYNFDVGRIKYFYSIASGPTGFVTVLNESEFNYRERSTIDYPKNYKLTKTISTDYFLSEELVTETTYKYNTPRLLLEEQLVTTSYTNPIITKMDYPEDITSPSLAEQKLITQNRIAQPIQTQTYKDIDNDGVADTNELLSTQYTIYKDWGNEIVLPEIIQTLKGVYNSGTNTLQNRIVFQDYYANGNIKEVSKKDGAHIVYIWGYNQTLPIAKIENATYIQVLNQVANLQSKSDLDDDRTIGASGNEGILRTALNGLRSSLLDAMITTYTYDPLIGITSITDPKGYTSYYEYDAFNRLKQVKDADGKILSENNYHYKNQQ